MRTLFFLLLILGGVGAAAYYTKPELREKFREKFQLADEDRERFDAYQQGKALFKSTWEEAPNATFEAWGDDALETATLVGGDVWMARGHVTVNKGGDAKLQEAWCLAFDRKKGTAVGRAVGKEAEDTEAKIDSGEVQKSMVQAVKAAIPTPIPKATPVPGSWMWEKTGRGPLEGPAKKANGGMGSGAGS
jgi:hypothetical protein